MSAPERLRAVAPVPGVVSASRARPDEPAPAPDLEALRARLQETEEILRAIRLGEVDALVIEGPDGPRTYTLVTADQSYRMLVEQMREAALTLSREGVILYCNGRLATLLQLPDATVTGRSLIALALEEDRQILSHLLQQAGAGAATGEVRLSRSDGLPVPLQFSLSSFQSGGFIGICAVATDLTEHRRREEILTEERLTRGILEFAGTAIVVCDAGGRLIRANRMAVDLCGEEWIGRTIDEILGVSLQELAGEEDPAAPERELSILRPDGRDRFLSIRVRPIGELLASAEPRWVVTLNDVTERREVAAERLRLLEAERVARTEAERLAAELGERQTLLDAVLEQMPSGISIAEAPTGRFLFHNREAEQLLGHPLLASDDYTGYAHYGALHADLTPYAPEEYPLARALGGETVRQEEMLYRRSDGTLTHLWVSAAPVRGASGAIVLAVCAFGDLSERKRAEAELRLAKERAEAASQAKSQFLAVMSHELRTPLTAVVGYAELLRDGIYGEVNEIQQRHLRDISSSADFLVAIIEDILTLARLEAGREAAEVQLTDLAALTRDTIGLLRIQARAKGLVLRTDLPEILEVVTDGSKFRQIVVNLLGNAIKFTEAGEVRVMLRVRSGGVVLEVSDTGPGIAPEDLRRIFSPFTQVDASTTRTKHGTGLGLTVSRNLARLLGGDVKVKSVPGNGSTFSLRLPIRPPGSSAPERASAAQP
jgi:PAS domain S-box-containing protein